MLRQPSERLSGRKIILLAAIVIVLLTCACIGLMLLTYFKMNYVF